MPQFLLKRQVPCLSEINGDLQETITQAILTLNLLSSEPITLLIDSFGGAVKPARYIGDAIRCSVAPVNGLVVGDAYSMSFLILQNCRRRIVYPHARVMFHGYSLTTSPRCDMPDYDEEVQGVKRRHSEDLAFIAERTKQPLEKWQEWSRREKIFEPVEALALGIIDEIVTFKPIPGLEDLKSESPPK